MIQLPLFECTTADLMQQQVGGNHYKEMAIQPVEFIEKNNLTFLEGQVIKYVSRHRRKGGLEDLQKARHSLELLIKFTQQEKTNV